MSALLHHLVEEAAQRRPEGLALRCDGESVSYGELSRRVNGIAHLLLGLGLERRDRVAVLLAKGPKVAAAFYGVLAAGGTLVPIDPKSPVEQVVRILRATGARMILSEGRRRAIVEEALAACPEIRHVIGIAAEDLASTVYLPWESWQEQVTDRAPQVNTVELDPSYVLHTSGSTGLPKLIQHSHRSALAFVDWAVAEYALTPEDRLSNHSSHHTCFATFDYYAAAGAGAATVILTPASLMMPASLAALIERERVSVWYSVPTALVQLALRGGLESRDLKALRWVLFAGETFPSKHLRRCCELLPQARFSHVYGSTEVNVCTCYHLPETDQPIDPLPIGKACSNARAVVVDESMEEVPEGGVGELLIRGSTVMSGYWGDPERNREVLVRVCAGELRETYFRTGDRVRRRKDGNLTFVARADLQVKVRGHRVELEEVEAALLSIGSVEEAAAWAIPDDEGSSEIRAAVVLALGGERDERELMTGLQQVLPMHALPRSIFVLPGLPRTPTGKVDRNALMHSEGEGTDHDAT